MIKPMTQEDTTLFEGSMIELNSLLPIGDGERVVDIAKRYYEDTKYYLEKGDYFTAFGCINYAHGLIDGIKKRKGKGGEGGW